VIYRPHELPGFVAEQSGQRVGLVTYQVSGDASEIVTLDSSRPGIGVGTALIEAVKEAARAAGCRRLWLVTTNDNLEALRFYQQRGFVLVAVHRNAVEAARRLKPEIPRVGAHGIPLRDEIELELLLD
jgi:DNA-3-methyladenine glycosylase I